MKKVVLVLLALLVLSVSALAEFTGNEFLKAIIEINNKSRKSS